MPGSSELCEIRKASVGNKHLADAMTCSGVPPYASAPCIAALRARGRPPSSSVSDPTPARYVAGQLSVQSPFRSARVVVWLHARFCACRLFEPCVAGSVRMSLYMLILHPGWLGITTVVTSRGDLNNVDRQLLTSNSVWISALRPSCMKEDTF